MRPTTQFSYSIHCATLFFPFHFLCSIFQGGEGCKPGPAYTILTTYHHIIIHPQWPYFDIDPLCISPCLTVCSTSYIRHLMYGYILSWIPVDSLVILPLLPCLLLLQQRSIYSLSTYIIVSYSCNEDYSVVLSVCLSLSVGLQEHASLPSDPILDE